MHAPLVPQVDFVGVDLIANFSDPRRAWAWARNYVELMHGMTLGQNRSIFVDLDTALCPQHLGGTHARDDLAVFLTQIACSLPDISVFMATSESNRERAAHNLNQLHISTPVPRLITRTEGSQRASEALASMRAGATTGEEHQRILLNISGEWDGLFDSPDVLTAFANPSEIQQFNLRQICKVLPDDQFYILSCPDEAWMSVKLPNTGVRCRINMPPPFAMHSQLI
jgi:hypothetical protein